MHNGGLNESELSASKEKKKMQRGRGQGRKEDKKYSFFLLLGCDKMQIFWGLN